MLLRRFSLFHLPQFSAFVQSCSYKPFFLGRRMQSSQLREKTDEEILDLLIKGKLKMYKLETELKDTARSVAIRRKYFIQTMPQIAKGLKNLSFENFNYDYVNGRCCENVVGFVQIPVGLIGPLKVDGINRFVPLATTEGALVASTHRGCKAITESGSELIYLFERFKGGADTVIISDGMTRAPVLRTPSAKEAVKVSQWLKEKPNFHKIAQEFNKNSRFARLSEIKTTIAGKYLYIRFKSKTGDAMGMNMVSKGSEQAIKYLLSEFPSLECLSLSGNLCTDKKPSAVNWIEGRGKYVVCETIVKEHVLNQLLKTDVDSMIDLNVNKNLVGSALSGSIGGFNAHASNLVTALFLATGQDPAQNVESSNCITQMERQGNDLYVSVTMPSLEVGTVGGGTHLPSQSACLEMLAVKSFTQNPGEEAETLARIVAGTVLAGEISLMAALSSGHLVRAHQELNSSKKRVEQ